MLKLCNLHYLATIGRIELTVVCYLSNIIVFCF